MKTVALLGGMTYEATGLYYTTINHTIRQSLGGAHSASLLLHSFDFDPLLSQMQSNDWDAVTKKFVSAATHLKSAGADALVICANYPHRVADELERQSGLQVLHIADFTAAEIVRAKMGRVGLLGTRDVMEMGFVKDRIERRLRAETSSPSSLSSSAAMSGGSDGGDSGERVLIPTEQAVRDQVHDTILRDLTKGIVTPELRAFLIETAKELVRRGAQGVILGSTDLGFALKQGDLDVPLFDSNRLHAEGVAKWMIETERKHSID